MGHHVMFLPVLSCPGQCRYCFGPRRESPVMSVDVLVSAIEWAQTLRNGEPERLTVLFHGGEPLVPGIGFYREALPLLRGAFGKRDVGLGIQSNLHQLTEELAELLAENHVSIGTSLDGPQEITDRQRGAEYFARTMEGVTRARVAGVDPGCICTFTRPSAPLWMETFNFFCREGLDFVVHPAVPPLPSTSADHPSRAAEWALPAGDYGDLLIGMFDRYLKRSSEIRIQTFDGLCRTVVRRQAEVCTHQDCLGRYMAVDPMGDIYPCQRFVGKAEWRLGNVRDRPGREELSRSQGWAAIQRRNERAAEACQECPWWDTCQGGCPYDALAAGRRGSGDPRDPFCPAFRRVFEHITDEAAAEVCSLANIEQVVAEPGPSVLRIGRIAALLEDASHPVHLAQRAKMVLAAAALGSGASVQDIAERLVAAGVSDALDRAELGVALLRRRILRRPGLNRLYLHVTWRCDLECDHCYAQAGGAAVDEMPPGRVRRVAEQAADEEFRYLIVTGGEVLAHSQVDEALEGLTEVRQERRELRVGIRTNLADDLTEARMRRLVESADDIGVSIDGDEAMHDSRRGQGAYAMAVANLRRLVAAARDGQVALKARMSLGESRGRAGEAVRNLARELGIEAIGYRPVMPLGRAGQAGVAGPREAAWTYNGVERALASGYAPGRSCGLGENLYVGPSGEAYPCYALVAPCHSLGNVCDEGGLAAVLRTSAFAGLADHTVDTNERCRRCELRYLCGGACRAWDDARLPDLDAPPSACGPLHQAAVELVRAALDRVGVSTAAWRDAGLPLPSAPPPPTSGACLKCGIGV